MKTLALILISVMGFAQTQDRQPSSLHLLDKTNPAAKRDVAATVKKDYAEFCFAQAAKYKDETWRHNEALQDCVNGLHKQQIDIGYENCQKILSAVTSGNVKSELKTACNDHYGYEGCILSGTAAKECIEKQSSSLSPDKCASELTKHKLDGDKKLVSLCKNGMMPAGMKPAPDMAPARGKKSNQ